MSNRIETKIVTHSLNGFADEAPKFVEVDGGKFVPDETDPTKAKIGEDGKPVPFVEKKADIKIEDLSKAALADLAKVNPEVAKLLDEHGNLKKTLTDKEIADKKAAEDALAEQGKWKDLAETRNGELSKTKETLAQKEEQLGKYVETVTKVLTEVMATIPEANRALIPDKFSPREKLEYIAANAKLLGAKVGGGTGKVEKSEVEVDGTEEGKMVTRLEELMKKGALRTSVETQEMQELGTKLTNLRREKANKKT